MARKTDLIIPEQVQRNIARFPSDFMFQLNNDETKVLRSQIATSKKGRGGRKPELRILMRVNLIVVRSERRMNMPLEINYDESGTPKTVVLSYDEYQALLAKPEEHVIVQQTAGKITELIQRFVREVDAAATAGEPAVQEPLSGDEFALPEDAQPLEEKPAPPGVRRYKSATGYYDSYGFRVLKGSEASGYPSDTFNRLQGAVMLRNELIERGFLVREGDWGNYTFTQDYLFESPSAAACIVDGNSRSGPEAWGRR